MKMLFIISLPRSGSTLLQRIIASHPEVATIAEPWLLLPLSALFSNGASHYAAYSFKNARLAMDDLYKNFGAAEESLRNGLAAAVEATYSEIAKASGHGNAKYFLDKTPRYYLISEFLAEIFHDARFIYLTRSIDHTMASIFNTWYKSKAMLNHHFIDLSEGPLRVLQGYKANASRSIHLRYEDIVENPTLCLRKIGNLLEVDEKKFSVEKGANSRVVGIMGDPTGQYKYTSVIQIDKSRQPLDTIAKKLIYNRLIKNFNKEVIDFFNTPAHISVNKNDRIGFDDAVALLASYFARHLKLSLHQITLESKNHGMKLS